jgi:hypothetical protein
MARKLNRKFIIVVGGVTLAAVVGVGSIAVWRVSSGPERNAALGDAALAAGRVNEAVDRFGRAANKSPDRVDYWKKYVGALERQVTNTSQAGTQNFFQLLAGRSKLAEADPSDVNALATYLDQLDGTNPSDVVLACSRAAPAFARFPKQTAMINAAMLSATLRQWESKRAGLEDAERKLLDLARAPDSGMEPWLGLIEYASARLEAAQPIPMRSGYGSRSSCSSWLTIAISVAREIAAKHLLPSMPCWTWPLQGQHSSSPSM